MRSPRLRDARAWSAARLANRHWLERAFPPWGDDWESEQSPAAWVERCRRLRSTQARGEAYPFVLLLDGRLIGELGIDAVDMASRTGEASVWMVKEHGSRQVMDVASLLLTHHVFCQRSLLHRLVSPVATSSRSGRAPGLRAAGLTIEATVPRPVGHGAGVDHDIWVLHNTAVVRAGAARAVEELTAPRVPVIRRRRFPPAAVDDITALSRGFALVTLRASRRAAAGFRPRGHQTPPRPRTFVVDGSSATLQPDGRLEVGGVRVGQVRRMVDIGTATAAVLVEPDNAAPTSVLAHVTLRLADEVTTWAPSARWMQVRVSTQDERFATALADDGFVHVASFMSDAAAGSEGDWPGEEWWSRAAVPAPGGNG